MTFNVNIAGASMIWSSVKGDIERYNHVLRGKLNNQE